MIRRFVTARFLALFIPVFLAFTLLALYAIAERHINASEDKIASRIGSQMGRITNLIGNGVALVHPDMSAKLASTLLSDPAITCVDVMDAGSPIKPLAQPKGLGCAVMKPQKSIAVSIPGMPDGQLRVGYNFHEIETLRSETTVLAIYTAIAGTLGAIIFGLLAFRLSVGSRIRKLTRFMASIDTDKDHETSTARIDISGEDEISELCKAFNDLQNRVSAERNKTLQTLEDLNKVYNTTPALLFTMTGDGIIQASSEYWLKATGYSMDQVVGKPLESVLCPHSRSRLKTSILNDLKAGSFVRDVPLSLWNKDGNELDVLLSVSPDRRMNSDGNSFVCIMNDVSLLRQAERDLNKLAMTDQLTGLYNRRWMNAYFGELNIGKHPEIDQCSVLFVDLDNFKTVNDTMGHEVGDEILRVAADRISAIVGDNGTPVRLGGDEFAVLLTGKAGICDAEKIAARICEEVSRPIKSALGPCHVGASIGLAHSKNFPDDLAETLRLSDQAMYLAKSNGKNSFKVYEESQTAEIQARAEQVQLIQNGISENWFDIYLQPIMDMQAMKPYAFEALLRVTKADTNCGSIEGLIRVAEETGQMEKLGLWIFKKAVSRFKNVLARHADMDISLTVNLSPQQLTEEFVRAVKITLLRNPELAGWLIFEITETAAMDRFDAVCLLLQDLRKAGIRIALDDFGTGYSSLSYISRLPIDILKLDKSFLVDSRNDGGETGQQKAATPLVRTLASLADELGLEVIAEGLETKDAQKDYQELGIRFGQGYLFSRPLRVADANSWLDGYCEQDTPKMAAAG